MMNGRVKISERKAQKKEGPSCWEGKKILEGRSRMEQCAGDRRGGCHGMWSTSSGRKKVSGKRLQAGFYGEDSKPKFIERLEEH